MGSRVGISLYLYNLNFTEMPSGDTVRFEVCAAQSQQGKKRESCQEISVEIFPQIKPCSSCRNQSKLKETIQIHKKVSLVSAQVHTLLTSSPDVSLYSLISGLRDEFEFRVPETKSALSSRSLRSRSTESDCQLSD